MLNAIGYGAKCIFLVLFGVIAIHLILHTGDETANAAPKDQNEAKWVVLANTYKDTLQMRYNATADNYVSVMLRHYEYDSNHEPFRLELFKLLVHCEPGGVAPATVGLQEHTVFDPLTGRQLGHIESPTLDGVPVQINVNDPIGIGVATACAAAGYAKS
jgi:hypothetical protein